MELQSNTTLQNGKLTIIKILGKGGFGITYLAEHALYGKVAIKEFFLSTANAYCTRSGATVFAGNMNDNMFDKFKQDFVNEAKTLSKLRDIPNVVNVHDYFEENNTVYFFMEYIEGESLQELVNRRGPLESNIALSYIQEVGKALISIHKKGILHRDIKPENIIINTQNNAILIDFGIAREFEEGEAKTHTGMATIGYAPPEQLVKKAKRGAFTDIFSLGGTLYFCLTGKRPQTMSEINLDGFVEARTLNPTITHKINKAIIKATKLKPEKRFQEIEDFLEVLGNKTKSKTNKPKQRKINKTKENPLSTQMYESKTVKTRQKVERGIPQKSANRATSFNGKKTNPIKMAFSKYATFKGRARRSEYWYFHLFFIGVVILSLGLDIFRDIDDLPLIFSLCFLIMLIPSLAVTIRRLHDTGKSGWWFLISFIPYIGSIILLILLTIKGNEGANRYGPDPKNPEYDDIFDHLVE